MTFPGFLLFAATYTLAVASPGPGIAALVAQVLARGVAGIWAFIAGMVLGDLIWLNERLQIEREVQPASQDSNQETRT